MIRDDNSNFLLYIEPKKEEKLTNPINDDLTLLIELAMRKAIKGGADYSSSKIQSIHSMMNDENTPPDRIDFFKKELEKNPELFNKGGGWRGFHRTDCGERSDNHDYKLENGLITNSLAPFYVKWYRNSIGKNDWLKLQKLGEFYGMIIDLPEVFPNIIIPNKKKFGNFIEEATDVMVKELTDTINKDIFDKLLNVAKNEK